MVVTAWVMLELAGDTPDSVGDPIVMRGDNVAAVTWVNRCGEARDKRACLLMRMLGRLEIKSGWSHDVKHIPGVQNTLADGISHCRERFGNGPTATTGWNSLSPPGGKRYTTSCSKPRAWVTRAITVYGI